MKVGSGAAGAAAGAAAAGAGAFGFGLAAAAGFAAAAGGSPVGAATACPVFGFAANIPRTTGGLSATTGFVGRVAAAPKVSGSNDLTNDSGAFAPSANRRVNFGLGLAAAAGAAAGAAGAAGAPSLSAILYLLAPILLGLVPRQLLGLQHFQGNPTRRLLGLLLIARRRRRNDSPLGR